jgi:putative (di)nucleoside polyphosphate hydrolase
LAESKDWYCYDLPAHLVPEIWDGKYRGQRQKWFVMRLQASDDHINISTAHPEFMDWKWQNLDQLPELIVPFKRDLYKALVEEFKPLITA